jgi:hypothetical protein
LIAKKPDGPAGKQMLLGNAILLESGKGEAVLDLPLCILVVGMGAEYGRIGAMD